MADYYGYGNETPVSVKFWDSFFKWYLTAPSIARIIHVIGRRINECEAMVERY